MLKVKHPYTHKIDRLNHELFLLLSVPPSDGAKIAPRDSRKLEMPGSCVLLAAITSSGV